MQVNDAPAGSKPIEDYALIGNCMSAGLVARDGSIDWLCFPRFDSAACCAALLGDERHGRWRVGAADPQARITRRYRPGTLVLETEIETDDGVALVVDCMTIAAGAPRVVRLVHGVSGTVAMVMDLVLRFDYGSLVPWVTRLENGDLRAIAGAEMIVLRTSVEYRGENMQTVAEFTVVAGETVPFELTWTPSYETYPDAIDPERAVVDTERFWREWSANFKGGTPYDEHVRRSLVTLKALTYAPTGGIVAAATTSLPESLGGERNWDYRFTWLRDATLTLSAMVHAGYYDEAVAWRDWLLRAVAGAPTQMQIMYGVAGDRRLPELVLPWLPGYAASQPVRIGNAASEQLQIDVFGDVMGALHAARDSGIGEVADGWSLQQALLEHLAEIWHEPDQGLWEIRGPAKHFVHSKVKAWFAFDRAIRSAERYSLEAPVDGWRAVRAAIRRDVEEHGYDAARNTFVQSYGSQELDASLLFLGATGFLAADDPRLRGTIEAIRDGLLDDGLVLRYRATSGVDGLTGSEGVFLACSFWLVDGLRLIGETQAASDLFERLIGLANDVGLYAEEYDPRTRRMLGNFPQAFSHLALVNSALDIAGYTAGDRRPFD